MLPVEITQPTFIDTPVKVSKRKNQRKVRSAEVLEVDMEESMTWNE